MTLRNLCCVYLAIILMFAGALLMPVGINAQSGSYTFVNIDYPGEFSEPLGVNDHGDVVGFWQDHSTGQVHGYYYDGTTYTTLDYPGAAGTEAVGINNDGVISGLYYTSGSIPYAFIYKNGTFTQLSYPHTPYGTDGQGINNNNEVVGYWGYYDSFVYNNGGYTSFNYPGAAVTYGIGINDSGQTSGYYKLTSSGDSFGFFEDGGTFTSIEAPGTYQTFALGLNNAGVVVGYGSPTDGSSAVSFLWQAGQFTILNYPDSHPEPFAINNNGQLLGVYTPSGVFHGFLATPTSGPPLQLVTMTPCRLVDTRTNKNPIQGGTYRNFDIPQLGGCSIPATALAYSLNVAVVPHRPLGYLTIWPAGEAQPLVATLNSSDGRVKANAAIVAAGTNQSVSVYVTDTTDLVLDIDGYFTAPSSQTLEFYPLTPCRMVDTRGAHGPLGGPRLAAQRERDFPLLANTTCIPADLHPAAYSLNFAAVPNPARQQLGYLTVWPKGESRPNVSTLNNPTATVVANAAIVGAGQDGEIAVYPYNTTDLVIDINGYFAAPGSGGYSLYTTAPCRVLDTRNNNGPPFSYTLNPPVNVPDSPCAPPLAEAYVFNATVVPRGSLGYLTLWPDTEQRPGVATLNAYDGFITSNMAIVPSINGSIDAYAYGTTWLILDLSAYFAP